jgi:hypothetical protein
MLFEEIMRFSPPWHFSHRPGLTIQILLSKACRLDLPVPLMCIQLKSFVFWKEIRSTLGISIPSWTIKTSSFQSNLVIRSVNGLQGASPTLSDPRRNECLLFEIWPAEIVVAGGGNRSSLQYLQATLSESSFFVSYMLSCTEATWPVDWQRK